MTRLLFMLLFFSLPLLSSGQEWKIFNDPGGNFTATYPPGWINKIKEGGRVFFTSPSDGTDDHFYENINIAVSYNKAYASTKISELFPGVTDQVKGAFNEFKEENLRYFKWNNLDAAELIYTGFSKSDESIRVRCTQWFCFYKSKLYLATFVSDASTDVHTKTAQKILSGIIFK
ncbi:MAG TPA: hypothetical protein PLZ45_14175 [Ferruginibacter sp.]|nr:hypothetical protein [Ferruginibacter sp.]